MDQFKEIMQKSFWEIALWRYGISLLLIFAALFMRRVLDGIILRRLQQFAAKTRFRFDELTIKALRRPLSILAVILGLFLAGYVLDIGPKANSLLRHALKVALALNAAYFLTKVVDALEEYFRPLVARTESHLDDQIFPVLRKSAKIFIVVVAGLLIIQNMGYSVAGLLTGLGLGGLALALAAQETLSNFFGSIAIFLDRPFQVGERVMVEGFDGPVEEIGFRSTKIRTLEGTLVTIPNSQMAKSLVDNIARRPNRRSVDSISVTYDCGYEKMTKALEIIRDVIRKSPDTEEDFLVYFNKFADYYLEILCIFWVKHLDYKLFLEAREKINLEIMRRFEEAEIEFAFPTQTLYVKSADGQPSAPRDPEGPFGVRRAVDR